MIYRVVASSVPLGRGGGGEKERGRLQQLCCFVDLNDFLKLLSKLKCTKYTTDSRDLTYENNISTQQYSGTF